MKQVPSLPRVLYGSLADFSDPRRAGVVYSDPAGGLAPPPSPLPGLNSTWNATVGSAQEPEWVALAESFVGDLVCAVGGDMAAEAAKFIAMRRNLPWICFPEALSSISFFTAFSTARDGQAIKRIDTIPSECVYIDLERIAAAPKQLRAGAIADVLSIATAAWDWLFAEEQERNSPATTYRRWAASTALTLVNSALDCAAAAGQGDPDGLVQLVDCLLLETALSNSLGHTRLIEGSEHSFAWAVEALLPSPLPHAGLVGPGILLMGLRQGQEVAPLERALHDAQIPLDLLPGQIIRDALLTLPGFCRNHDLPYGIAHLPAGQRPVIHREPLQ